MIAVKLFELSCGNGCLRTDGWTDGQCHNIIHPSYDGRTIKMFLEAGELKKLHVLERGQVKFDDAIMTCIENEIYLAMLLFSELTESVSRMNSGSAFKVQSPDQTDLSRFMVGFADLEMQSQ